MSLDIWQSWTAHDGRLREGHSDFDKVRALSCACCDFFRYHRDHAAAGGIGAPGSILAGRGFFETPVDVVHAGFDEATKLKLMSVAISSVRS